MNSGQPSKINNYLRTILFFLLLQLCAAGTYAQHKDSVDVVKKDPEKILRKLDIKSITRNGFNFWQGEFTGHWAGVDFGFNMFVNNDYSGYDSEFMENDVFRSNTTYLNIVQQSIGLQRTRNTFGLVTGLGLHLQSYRLDDNTTIYKDDNGVIQPQELYYDDNQKSKLSVVSLAVPLLAEFQIPINHYDNRIYFSAGLVGSVRLHNHTKIKYKSLQKEKLKVSEDFAIHSFKYSVMVRAGYRWFNVFASYDLVPLFEAGKGPEITPFTFGVTLISF